MATEVKASEVKASEVKASEVKKRKLKNGPLRRADGSCTTWFQVSRQRGFQAWYAVKVSAEHIVRSAGRAKMQTEIEKLKGRLFRDGEVKNIKFYPGANRDKGPEDWARQVNAFFASAEVDGIKPVDIRSDLDD